MFLSEHAAWFIRATLKGFNQRGSFFLAARPGESATREAKSDLMRARAK